MTHTYKLWKRKEECDTYLTHVCRHQHSVENLTFSQLQLMKVIALAESSSNLSTFIVICLLQPDSSQVGVALFPSIQHVLYYFTFPGFPFILILFFHRFLYAMLMSTDVSQVGVALFPSFFNIFYLFTLPGFSFYIIIIINCEDISKMIIFKEDGRFYSTIFTVCLHACSFSW